jgi:serine/threonine-protein kinase
MATVESPRPTTRSAASATSAAGHKLVGRLGPWQLVRLLAEGNLTRLYQARPAESAGNQLAAYAVKLLRNEWWRDPAAIELQRREAWVGARASHPNLLPVLSASVQEPPFYLVTPLLDATDLAQIMAAHGPLPISLALWITRQVADGLTALADATDMIHADVKPANILVSAAGHATLIDFGFVQTPSEARNWTTRPVVGTLAYIAPEMVTSTIAADGRCDIYSLGVTLYEMLAGCRPFESDDPGELATLQRESKPADVRAHRANVPEPVATLVNSMLAKDPLRRPDSAGALAARLIRLEIDCFTLG